MHVTDHIHALRVPFQIPLTLGVAVERFVYLYLLQAGDRLCLVDSGVASAHPLVLDYVKALGRTPADISLIVLTHAHPDHIGAAALLRESAGCSTAAHPAEQPWIEDVDCQQRARPVPGFQALVAGSVKVDRLLQDGDFLTLAGDLQAEVIHTTGHSAGSISLWVPADRALLCGDAIPLPGAMPIYEDPVVSLRTVCKLAAVRGVDVLLSSWDDPRRGAEVPQVMAASAAYLERVHAAVRQAVGDERSSSAAELCCRVLDLLGLPRSLANPLVARTFESHRRYLDYGTLAAVPADVGSAAGRA